MKYLLFLFNFGIIISRRLTCIHKKTVHTMYGRMYEIFNHIEKEGSRERTRRIWYEI